MNDFYCEQVFSGKTKVQKIIETDDVLAFYHTKPAWTFHVVVVPKQHVLDILDVSEPVLLEIMDVIRKIIVDKNLQNSNYKIVTNGGSFQDSKHLHFHLLSGKSL